MWTAVAGIAAGVLIGLLAVPLIAMLIGGSLGMARGARLAGWPGLLGGLVFGAWALSALALLVALPFLLVAWLLDVHDVARIARSVVSVCLWPTLLGLPLSIWLSHRFPPRGYDAG